MRKVFGICCIVLGVCCLIASVGFIAYNRWEAENAQNVSMRILQNMQEEILDNTHNESVSDNSILEESIAEETAETASVETEPDESAEIPGNISREMPAARVNGYDCIGALSIPVLNLELPVLADWSYDKLRVAPCHYFGSCLEENFVIAAHNYQAHFGRLSALQPKDLVLFTDISGTVYYYEVVLLETLSANAAEEMITSGFDLSLYTCTPGGSSRVTVRCNAISG